MDYLFVPTWDQINANQLSGTGMDTALSSGHYPLFHHFSLPSKSSENLKIKKNFKNDKTENLTVKKQ